MKQNKHKIWGFLLSLLSLCALLLAINLLSQSPQPAHAHTTQQTNNPPLEILVNNKCSQLTQTENDSGTPPPSVETFRFGDEQSHFYKFWGKAGNWYEIRTEIFNGPQINPVIGLDTMVFLYANNPVENPNEPSIIENDDKDFTGTISNPYDPYESKILFFAQEDRYYWIKVINRVENGDGSYCLGIKFDTDKTTGQHNTPDACEPNDSFEYACEIQLQELGIKTPAATQPNANPFPGPTISPSKIIYNFLPLEDTGPDQDFYKIWVKNGERYTCETKDLSQGNDTQIKIFNDDYALLLSNDDVQSTNGVATVTPDTRRSLLDINVGYTGWLYILVEPVVYVEFEYGHLYTYQLVCSAGIYQAPIDSHQPGPSNPWDAPAGSSSAAPQPGGVAEITETVVEATPTAPVVASKPEAVSFVALPPRTPTPLPVQPGIPATFTLQIYHDANGNGQKDEGEGVSNLPVYLYTGLTETPLQALTTEGGAVFVHTETAVGTIQLFVPYLNINQEIAVTDVQDIRLRVGTR